VHSRADNADRLQARAERLSIPTVAVMTPSAAPLTSGGLTLPGRVEAHARALIFARVAGYLKQWHADMGATVKAGQLLAEIDTPELDQQIRQAQAELASARTNASVSAATAKRWQALLAQNFVSAQAVEEKNGDLAIKQSLVNVSQANLDRLFETKKFARVLAPFAGVVTARSTDVGALITAGGSPGTELFVVSDLSRARLYVNVPQTLVGSVHQGDRASFSQPDNPSRAYPARVHSMARAIGNGSATMLVQLVAEQPDLALTAGGFVNVTFESANTQTGLKLPPSALIFEPSGVKVGTLDGSDHVVLKPVVIARDEGSSVVIASGLNTDDRVIESPPDGIANGVLGRVKPKPAPAAK
jgi:RND family efflux transporter MFP subunit